MQHHNFFRNSAPLFMIVVYSHLIVSSKVMVHVMGYSIVLKLLKTNLYLCNMLVISIPISPEMPTAANAGGFSSPKFCSLQ